MAEGKKKVIVYADWIHIFENLKDAEAGRLVKHFFRYINDKNPDAPDRITQISFEAIKQQLKRDLKGWENERHSRSEAGKKGMKKRWGDNNVTKSITNDNNVTKSITNDNNVTKSITNITDSVTVKDNVNDTVTDKVIKKKNIVAKKIEVIDEVFLKETEINSAKEYFQTEYSKAISILSNYKLSSGKKYKSDYHALIGWVADKMLKEKNIINGNSNSKTGNTEKFIGRIPESKMQDFINGGGSGETNTQ